MDRDRVLEYVRNKVHSNYAFDINVDPQMVVDYIFYVKGVQWDITTVTTLLFVGSRVSILTATPTQQKLINMVNHMLTEFNLVILYTPPPDSRVLNIY